MKTRDELSNEAWHDYHMVLDSVIEVHTIDAKRDEDHVVIALDPPLKARVVTTTEYEVVRWLNEWLDPVWNVLPLEQRPELAGTTSWWVFGPSYNVMTGARSDGSYVKETSRAALDRAHTGAP